MIATLVATKEGHWGAYVATQDSLEKQEQPTYMAPYSRPSEAAQAIDKRHPGQFLGYTDYGNFWQQVVEAGIEKPESMPHRQRSSLLPCRLPAWSRGVHLAYNEMPW